MLLPVSTSTGQEPDAHKSHALTFKPGSRIGRFEVLESLGVGGFSEVYSGIDYEATNPIPVAIKVMRMGLNSAEFLTRFEQEHQMLRRLEDPSIVRVFETGITEGGRPYFAMEQIDGLRITDFCESENLALDSRMEMFVGVCRAVHHAHQKGIIHRDLKPANILVAQRNGLLVPIVIDFGLAKAIETWNESSEPMQIGAWVTQLGITMGTPGYLSPEQADGAEDSDTLSDVFSLGVVLYELITNRPPWPHETWKKVPHSKWSQYKLEHPPLRPSEIASSGTPGKRIDDDLDTVCMKALAVHRDQRYESVAQLATDLRHWLRGDPILAKPPSLTYRLGKLISRYRWQSATAAASLLACVVVAVLGVILAIRERRYSAKWAAERSAAIDAKSLANEHREFAIHERTVAQHSAYASSIGLAYVHVSHGQPYLAQQILNATQPSLRSWEWHYLESQIPRPVISVPTELDSKLSFALSKNHKFSVVCDTKNLVRLDLEKGQRSPLFANQPLIQQVAISDDGQYIATLVHEETSSIKVYRYHTGESNAEASSLTYLWTVSVHGDSSLEWVNAGDTHQLIVVEGNGDEPAMWSVQLLAGATGELIHKAGVKRWKLADKGLAVGNTLAVVRCSFDRLAVLRISDLELLGYVYGFPNSLIEDFQLSEDESRVVMIQSGHVFETTWAQAEKEITNLFPNLAMRLVIRGNKLNGDLHRLNRTEGGKWLAVSDTHCIVEGESAVELPTKRETARVSLLDGTYATLLMNGDLEIRKELQELAEEHFTSRSVYPTPEGRRVVISPQADSCLYQTWSRQHLFRCLLAEADDPIAIETPENPKLEWSRLPIFHPDGTAVVIAAPEATANGDLSELVALRWGKEAAESEPLPIKMAPWSASVSSKGNKLYVGARQGVEIIDWATRSLVSSWELPNGPFVVLPMQDNSGFYAIGVDHVVHRISDSEGPKSSERVLEELPAPIPATSDFWAADQVLAIAASSGVDLIKLGEKHRNIGRIPTESRVTALRFSHDGKRLAVAMANRKIAIWDWKGNHRLMDLETRGTCSSIDFSNDGLWMVNTDYAPCLTIR